jgi:S-adenosyl-L-methionine hydrolase (adenosine-forming)
MARPFVSLLTDFGLRDPSAAICRGVVLGIAPDAEIADISHEVRKYAIRDGALLLWCALPYLPVGAHVAVVDPGVGTARRPIALRVERGDHLVGPDNGLLLMAADKLGGVTAAVELREAAYQLPVVSTSFHGRDVFAPAAAHLALGVPLERLGPSIDPAALVRLPIPEPRVTKGALETHVIYVDTFGNVKLTALAPALRDALGDVPFGSRFELELRSSDAPTRRVPVTWAETFGTVGPGEPLLYEDSYGRLCLAVNQGDAAATLGLVEDLAVAIRRAG